MEKIDKLDPSDLVFCDEMGVDNNICILHGWSEIGKRSYGDVDGFRSVLCARYISPLKQELRQAY